MTIMSEPPRPSRRSILARGGAAVLAAGGALTAGTGPAAAAGDPSPGAALLVPSARIDLNDGSDSWIREKALQNSTVLQSFGYDSANGRIYLAQVMQGGIRLADEPAAVSGAERSRHGDLAITQWDLAGNRLGSMYLRGFGHGVSIGVEPVGPTAYLWTEVDAVEQADHTSRGTRLARFPFADGTVLDSTSPALVKHTPVPGSTVNTASVDPVYGRLVHRYSLGTGVMHYRVHDLALARLGVWDRPLAGIDEPQITVDAATYGHPAFQGYAAVGRYLYLLHGNAYGSTETVDGTEVVISRPGVGNTFLSSVDLTTGAVVETRPTKAAYTLDYREPEGLGIHVPDPAQPGVFRLGLGFASNQPGTDHRATIYGKDLLVQP
ncbi:hypothetical protein GCM10010440_62350 [Kitasatospora cinereorecta]